MLWIKREMIVLAEMMNRHPIEEALAKFFDVDDNIDDTFADTFCYNNPAPYFKIAPLSDDRLRHNIRFDEDSKHLEVYSEIEPVCRCRGTYPYVLHELVKTIYVDASDKSSGKRRQHIHIQYDGL